MKNHDKHPKEIILILDFGSQYTQLIARRVREQGVYSEIKPYDFPIEKIKALKPKGIIFSGGPASVYQPDAPLIGKEMFDLRIPILGICYGLQLVSHLLGAKITQADHREYGHAELEVSGTDPLLENVAPKTRTVAATNRNKTLTFMFVPSFFKGCHLRSS